jgi:hypothetical protein
MNVCFVVRTGLWFVFTTSVITCGCSRNATVLEQKAKGVFTNQLVAVEILPDQLATNHFRKVITNANDLVELSQAFANADRKPVGGHGGPIYECTLILKFQSGTNLVFLASVHKRQTNDLYISDTFWQIDSNGCYVRGRPRRVRIPGLGAWIVGKEPRGNLESFTLEKGR